MRRDCIGRRSVRILFFICSRSLRSGFGFSSGSSSGCLRVTLALIPVVTITVVTATVSTVSTATITTVTTPATLRDQRNAFTLMDAGPCPAKHVE